jgi:uncharacterized protein YdaU (DUF1376 family)
MHYFQFNIGDYASHTRHLSLMEDLAYRRMLDSYYLREQPLPLGPAEVARLIGMRDHLAEVEQVLSDFFSYSDCGWQHDRADAEIAHFRDKSAKASSAGKASAQRRLNERSTDVQPTNNQQPITNNQEPDIPPPKPLKTVEELPDWMPLEAWHGWVDMRRQRKKALTVLARKRAIAKLEAMLKAGQDIAEVLDRSTMNCWTDLYEIKERANGTNRTNKDGVSAALDEMLGIGRPAEPIKRRPLEIFDEKPVAAITGPDTVQR